MSGERDWQPLFPAEEIPRILSVVERCASRLRKEKETELENRLSDRLRALIVQDVEYRDRVAAQVHRELCIYDQTGKIIAQMGRGDIAFEHGTGVPKPYPYFLIEAKRLHVTFPSGWDSLVAKYVTGSQGMMCFTKGRYSSDMTAGAMLGYVFDNQVQKARDSVNAMIVSQASKLQCQVPHGLSPSGFAGTTAEHSTHSLRGWEFVIYHIFVAV
jgi:hypothetical protein